MLSTAMFWCRAEVPLSMLQRTLGLSSTVGCHAETIDNSL